MAIAVAIIAGAWPVVIPPPAAANPFRSPGTVTDADSGAGGLGQSVAIDGDGTVAVVGEPNTTGGAGAALVYTNADGVWSFSQRLTPTGEIGAGHFGAAVSIDTTGSGIVVGAPDDNGGVGAAWTFAQSNGTWTQQARLTGGAAEIGAGRFGASVAIANGGLVALIGAPMSNAGMGQAFTFHYTDLDGWYRHQRMSLAGVVGAAHFGASVALASNGSSAIVGAPNAAAGDGAVYPFSYWGLESPYWIDNDPITSPISEGNFGASVTMSSGGEHLIIGAPAARTGDGAVYEYTRAGVQQAALINPSHAAGGQFGASVAFAGDTMDQLLVGAPGENGSAGAAYDFDASAGTGWATNGAAIAPLTGPDPGDAYGTAVAVAANGSHAAIGAPGTGGAAGAFTHVLSANITAPGSPLYVQVVAGTESADVSWIAPYSTGGSPITSYTVTSSPDGRTCQATTIPSCTVSGLAGGRTYTFSVTATNGFGTSAPSDPSSGVTPTSPPGSDPGDEGDGGSGDGGSGGTAPGGTAPGGVTVPSSGATGTGTTTTTASILKTPTLTNPLSNPPGSMTSSDPAGPPPRPRGPITAVQRTRTAITISWRAPSVSTRVACYRVYELIRGRWRLVGTTSRAKRAFTRTSLRHRTRHRFEVRASDAKGRLSPGLRSVWISTR